MIEMPEMLGCGAARTLIIADDAAPARSAVEEAGGRVLQSLSWAQAAAGLGEQAVLDCVLVEAAHADADALDTALPRLDAFVRASGVRAVVVLDEHQIDAVTAQLFGDRVRLLCDPARAERVAALALAGLAPELALNDSASEAEAARLRRLDEEVARIAQTLARLTRRDAGTQPPRRDAGMLGDRRPPYRGAEGEARTPIAAADVRQAIRARRLRDQFFARGLFEDPAWDMLLDLYAAELEQRRVSVSSLCIAAAVAPTTALRWIGRMTESELFERQPDPFDRRRSFIALTTQARAAMHDYCKATRNQGLAIA